MTIFDDKITKLYNELYYDNKNNSYKNLQMSPITNEVDDNKSKNESEFIKWVNSHPEWELTSEKDLEKINYIDSKTGWTLETKKKTLINYKSGSNQKLVNELSGLEVLGMCLDALLLF